MTTERALLLRLHRRAGADRWALAPDEFAAVLQASVALRFPQGGARADLDRYLEALHLEDLALASACAAGAEAAWEYFVREHRPGLYRAADAIDPSGRARELADALYADLFGLSAPGAERRSLFRYFHGRSTLATWLRAVLSQRYVDWLRQQRRFEPLADDHSAHALAAAAPPPDPNRSRFLAAMTEALTAGVAGLSARDRLRLGCYYSENLTLAEIGRLLGEHEATASRQLARTRRDLRAFVDAHLRQVRGFSESDILQAFESLAGDSGTLDLAAILDPGPARKNEGDGRSTQGGS